MTPLNGRYLFFLIYFWTFPAWSDESSNTRISFEAVKNHLETLDTRGIESGSYSLLSIDGKYNQLLVGAKDNTFLVDLENINSFQSWNLTKSSSSNECGEKQNGPFHNFVKIMIPFNGRILLCWTGNQMTECAWRNRTNLSDVPSSDTKGNVLTSKVEYCSSPDQNDTAIITEHGTFFTGGINDFYRRPMISSRSLRPNGLLILTSFNSHSDLYTDVQFVKSFNIGHYVYFFFRERTLECSSCGKLIISRVARICKGDYGGPFNLKTTFVTFQKAKLICSDGADFPLNFNEIQDVWWDDKAKSFYTIFLSHPNGPPSSAICMYTLSDINHVFDESRFKSFDKQDEQWISVENNHKEYFKDCKVDQKYIDQTSSASVPHGMMATRKVKFSVYQQFIYYPLMEDPVEPISIDAQSKRVSRALFIKDGVRMTGIAVDKVGAHSVVYTSTDRGSVLKISRPAGVHQPCLLAEFDIFPDDQKEVIKAMTLDTTRHVLYLGSDTALTKLSLEQCSSYDRHSSCTSAADPYCAWDNETNHCVSILSHGDLSKLKQDLSACPKMAVEDVEWSPWKSCIQSDGNHCRCQVRPCQNKQNSSCEGGYEFRFENCTDGEWDRWSNWGQCTVDGFQIRRRQCKAEPCFGEKLQERKCPPSIPEIFKVEDIEWSPWKNCIQSDGNHCRCQVRPCQNKQNSSCEGGYEFRFENCTDGEWDRWSDWGQCTVDGFKIRRRQCKAEPCFGEKLQERKCQPTIPEICKEVKLNPTPETNEGSEVEVGHVIGAAVAVFVLTFILFLGVLYYVMIKYCGVPKRDPPSTSNSHSKATKDST